MYELVENLLRVDEAENQPYRNNVQLSVDFEPIVTDKGSIPALDDDHYTEIPDNVVLMFDLDVEHRSWGIKDIAVQFRKIVEFDCIIRSDLPDEEGKEVVIPVRIDFSELTPKINWVEGNGYAPAELHVTLGGKDGKEIRKVEVDFYYLKPSQL